MTLAKVECPFCGVVPEGKGGFVWCVNPKCWIKGRKIPKKVWSERTDIAFEHPIRLGSCNTCVHKNCFSRVNIGEEYATLDFCSVYYPDPSLSLESPLADTIKEGYSQIAFSKELLDKMPIGWLVLFNRLLESQIEFRDNNPKLPPLKIL